MQSWLAKLRCSQCHVIAGGEDHCEFCGHSLHPRNALLKGLSHPLRILHTYVLIIFAPWRAGTYLADQKRGALASPANTLGPAATLFYAAQLAALGVFGAIPLFGFERETWQGKLVFYLFFGFLILFQTVLFYGFVRAFGSNARFSSTLIGISYTLSAWFLVIATLLTLRIGLVYQMLSESVPSRLPLWQWIVEALASGWLWIGSLIIIQSKIHRLPWYRVSASAILAGIGYCGWLMYFIVREYSCYF
jgi:hypothetical protein